MTTPAQPRRKRRAGRPHPRTPSSRGRGRPAVRGERKGSRESEALDLLATRRIPRRPPADSGTPTGVGSEAGPLEIVMVGWEFPPSHTGGLGVHCYEICREIAKLGHRITFLSPFAGPFTPVEGVTFRHPGDRAGGSPREFPPAYWSGELPGSPFADGIDGYNAWIAGLALERRPDVVHVHDWFGTRGAVELAARIRVPLVMTVHSTEYDRSLGHPWKHILDREQAGISGSTRVIAVSQHLRMQLIERYRAEPARVAVIYNAVRPSERLAEIDPKRRVVLYVGRLAVMKGVDTFLRAAAAVAGVLTDVLFVIAGEGPEYGRLIELAAQLGIGERVMFLGKVSDDERELLLAGASVFVLPSVVEPFGIAALEAMAAGVPTIVSKTSGVAEISSGTFRVDFWDVDEFASRISELLEYPTLRQAMGEQGQWEALRAGWPERAVETLAVYREAMRAGPRRP